MDKIDAIGLGIIGLIAIIGLSCVAIKHENHTIEQSDKLEKVCLKAYKTDLKDDNEVKELCKNVEVRIGEL